MKKVFLVLGLSIGLSLSFQTPNLASSNSCGTPQNEIKNSRVIWGVYISPNLIDNAKDYGCTDAFLVENNGKQWAQIATFKNENEAKDLADYLGGWYARKTLWGESEALNTQAKNPEKSREHWTAILPKEIKNDPSAMNRVRQACFLYYTGQIDGWDLSDRLDYIADRATPRMARTSRNSILSDLPDTLNEIDLILNKHKVSNAVYEAKSSENCMR
jgi:hypothetical protein